MRRRSAGSGRGSSAASGVYKRQALGTEVCPLGLETDNQALLAIDAEGRVYALDHTGDWYLGPDIDQALATLISGITPVRLTAG